MTKEKRTLNLLLILYNILEIDDDRFQCKITFVIVLKIIAPAFAYLAPKQQQHETSQSVVYIHNCIISYIH